MSTVFVACQP